MQTLKLRWAALNLRTFTVAEIHQMTGVPEATVHTFLHRLDADHVESKALPQDGRGRPRNRYTLTAAGVQHLQSESVEERPAEAKVVRKVPVRRDRWVLPPTLAGAYAGFLGQGALDAKGRVLVVADAPEGDILRAILQTDGFLTNAVTTGEEALQAAHAESFDVLLTDLRLPDMNGLELIGKLDSSQLSPCLVVMTGYGSVEDAVGAMKKGAFDYLTKPLERDRLLRTVRAAADQSLLQTQRLLHESHAARQPPAPIVGRHESIRRVLEIVNQAAASNVTVLISGESGTGKELIARALHHVSGRRERTFCALNVAAVPKDRLEVELFGAVDAPRRGLFELASGSTLFLDEVDELASDLQLKLLRALQEHEIRHVGGGERVKVDVRLVAATNRDLLAAVRAGRFREDLFYRLNLIQIAVPPLRARPGDIPLLVEHFLETYRGPERARELSPAALQALQAYGWPGNVRELENVVARAVLVSQGDDPIDLEHLPVSVVANASERDLLDEAAAKQSLILKVIEEADGDVTRATRFLRDRYRHS